MKKLIIAFLLLTIMIVACEPGAEIPEEGVPFIGGTTGLLISFVEDAPPPEVYDGGDFPFDIELKLQNEGERTIKKEDTIVKISGIDPAEFGKTAADFIKNSPDDLVAKTKDAQGNIIESSPVYVTFADLNHEQLVTGDLNYPIFATACYKYGTDAISRICIKENLLEKGGVCEVQGEKPVLNSGAPVQVTSLTESIIGTNKIRLTFRIEHKGNGRVSKAGTECNKENLRENMNQVFVSVSTGLPNLECDRLKEGTGNTGYLRLTDGSAVLSCEQPVTAVGAFLKTVDMKLEYDYEEDVVTSLIVRHTE